MSKNSVHSVIQSMLANNGNDAPKAKDSNTNNSVKEENTMMNENKTAIDFNGIETAIEFAIEGINPLISEMNAAELVIALQKAAQRLAKENNVGSNELKATRAAYNAEKRAAVKAEKDATKAANKAAKASASKAEKDAAKAAANKAAANAFAPFAQIVGTASDDEKAALNARCASLGITVAKARAAYKKVYPDGYFAAASVFFADLLDASVTEMNTMLPKFTRYCKAHKVNAVAASTRGRILSVERRNAAAPAAC